MSAVQIETDRMSTGMRQEMLNDWWKDFLPIILSDPDVPNDIKDGEQKEDQTKEGYIN